jgi:hypothetical protein
MLGAPRSSWLSISRSAERCGGGRQGIDLRASPAARAATRQVPADSRLRGPRGRGFGQGTSIWGAVKSDLRGREDLSLRLGTIVRMLAENGGNAERLAPGSNALRRTGAAGQVPDRCQPIRGGEASRTEIRPGNGHFGSDRVARAGTGDEEAQKVGVRSARHQERCYWLLSLVASAGGAVGTTVGLRRLRKRPAARITAGRWPKSSPCSKIQKIED